MSADSLNNGPAQPPSGNPAGRTEETYFSQFGDDRLLWQLFNGRRDGFFAEVGANHPTIGSQTYFLEQKGWRGLLVEPLPEKCKLLREHRPRSLVFECAVGAPEQRGSQRFHVGLESDVLSGLAPAEQATDSDITVQVRTLDEVLGECGNPELDVLSIDVEGNELNVMKGFSLERFRPKVLLLEDHHHSLKLHRHVTSRGYRLVKRNDCNSWYAPADVPFPLNTFGERLGLRREIWVDTPIRILRLAIKRFWTGRGD